MTTWTRIGDATIAYSFWILDENLKPILDETNNPILAEQSLPVPSTFTVWTKIYQ